MFKKIIKEKISILEKTIESELGYHLSKQELRNVYQHIYSLKEISFGKYVIPYDSIIKLKEYFDGNSKDIPQEIVLPIQEKIGEIKHLIILQKPELKDYLERNKNDTKL